MRRFWEIRGILSWGTLWGALMAVGCGGSDDGVPTASIEADRQAASWTNTATANGNLEPVKLTPSSQDDRSPAQPQTHDAPEVRISTSLGDILARLNADLAPRTVENFLFNYVERGFYDQTVVHFVEPGYMIAAGGYDLDFAAKETRSPILCEADNGLKNLRGTLAMVRHQDLPHSATSQFFINLVDNPALDYQAMEDQPLNGYCVFGEVIEGFEVLEKIAAVAVHDRDDFVNTPEEPVIIQSVTRVK
jgi:peptidyl-prolyl cis-trans isomerase A (cyclophilin A)